MRSGLQNADLQRQKYIGAYAAAMGGVDAIVFTAGIGENSATTRQMVTEGLEFLGVKMDCSKNNFRGEERVISAPDSKVKVIVIPTNEELVIARDTKRWLSERGLEAERTKAYGTDRTAEGLAFRCAFVGSERLAAQVLSGLDVGSERAPVLRRSGIPLHQSRRSLRENAADS